MSEQDQICPMLPRVDHIWRAQDMACYRESKNADYYLAALCYAQSLLSEGKPAQALLQINKSFMAELSSGEILATWPPAYEAVGWIIESYRGQEENFLGNPVRHYQHLATRMSGPRAAARSLRAWACFHLAEKIAPEFPRDQKQIAREALSIPSPGEVIEAIDRIGWENEGIVLRGTLSRCTNETADDSL